MDLKDEKPTSGLAEVLRLSWPASLTMLNRTLFQFVDGWLVSGLGPAPFNAQMVGGLFAFVPEGLAMGTLTVVNTYVSQNLGADRLDRCGQYAWAGLRLAAVFALLFAPLALVAGPIFRLFGHAEQALEAMFFQYMILSILLSQSTMVLQQFFFGIHRPRIVLVVSVFGNAFNIAANYVLIYGKCGFPALGLQGSAIGIMATWALMLAILLAIYLSQPLHRRFATRRVRSATWRQCVEVVKVGWPAGVQFLSDVLPWAVFLAALVGIFGLDHRAASSAAMRWMQVSFMPAMGIGLATTALVGKYIGQGRPDLARRRAHTGLIVAMIYMGLCGLTFWLAGRQMVEVFVKVLPSEEMSAAEAGEMASNIVRIGTGVMLCAAVFQLFDAVGIVFVGALRGAGDTFWPMVFTMILSWALTVGGGYAMVRLLPQWTSIGPWIAASAYVIVLGVLMAWRFEGGAWGRIDLLGRRDKLD